jgi:MFS family permease
MYSESDLAGAVEAGVLSPDAANALRNYVAAASATPAVDEESFRLLTGFNDIFVAIAAALILVATGWIGFYFGRMAGGPDFGGPRVIATGIAAGGFTVALVSWLLAEYFTRQRRMALPSILLLLGFVGGIAAGLGAVFTANAPWISEQFHLTTQDQNRDVAGVIALVIGLVTAAAAWLHWRRFMVPITVAAGTVTVIAIVIPAIIAFVPDAKDALNPMLLIAGLVVFAVAMTWDMSDRERRTRRSDVAFWLHLAAAPLIAHPIFHMLGVFNGNIGVPMALLVIALYVVFAFVALAVDRRALLVSSLVYVLWAMYALFQETQAVELSAALTGLVIGSALLMLSAFWQPMRRGVVGMLGGLSERLPPTQQLALA